MLKQTGGRGTIPCLLQTSRCLFREFFRFLFVHSVPGKLVIKCFGHFDVYWKDKPLIFARKQSKELLAYLIDREGAACTPGEIALALWQEGGDTKTEQNRIRVLISDLRNTLKEIGMENVLIREHREIAIRRDLVDCDYYRMLDGDMDAANEYRGEYMLQYSWAETKNAAIHFKQTALKGEEV